jgi:hypothetical protein
MLRASDDSGLKDADVSQMSQEQILIKIEQLQLTSRSLLDELQRQNEYDRSRGITPGKFREHFTIGSIGMYMVLPYLYREKIIISYCGRGE